MTGYGKVQQDTSTYEAAAEIKTLNSKFLDANIKLPRAFADKEIEIRSLLAEKIKRGKISLTVDFTANTNQSTGAVLNKEVFKTYYRAYQDLKNELNDTTSDIFRLAAQVPDAMQSSKQEAIDESVWKEIKQVITKALDSCNQFRIQEGAALEKDLKHCISSIRSWMEKITEQIPQRDSRMKEKLKSQFEEMESELVDKNRFEQELIYYIEKLDINEEIVRLGNHLDYFTEVLQTAESNGKKLGFISQEIGREINTIGSKANDAGIQHQVVSMKEELEKIKEQILNIL